VGVSKIIVLKIIVLKNSALNIIVLKNILLKIIVSIMEIYNTTIIVSLETISFLSLSRQFHFCPSKDNSWIRDNMSLILAIVSLETIIFLFKDHFCLFWDNIKPWI